MTDLMPDRTDIVAPRDRLRQLQLFRLVTAVGLGAALVIGVVTTARSTLVVAGLVGFAAATTVVVLAWDRGGWRRAPVMAASLIVDGLALTAVRLLVEDPSGTIAYLPVLHVVITTLLGSYPTGGKLAAWHTLLYFAGAEAVTAGMLPTMGLVQGAVVGPLVLMWSAMFVTAGASELSERELRGQRADLETLASFSSRVQVLADPAEIARELHRSLCEIAEVREVVLIEVDDADILEGPRVPDEVEPMSADVVATAVRTAERQFVRGLDPERDTWLADLLPASRNIGVLPGTAEGVAVLVAVLPDLAAEGTRAERRVIASLERVLAYGTMAFRNARLRDDLSARATTDGLTGIPNRASLDRHLDAEFERATRAGTPLAVAMIDVDHFKMFNDTHGHLRGDEALQVVASELTRASRGYDVVARFGGEEFAVVLPHTGISTAAAVAERLRTAVAAITAISEPVTVSIGVASSRGHESVEELLGAADAALYRAKHAGRDQVVVEAPPVEREPTVPAR